MKRKEKKNWKNYILAPAREWEWFCNRSLELHEKKYKRINLTIRHGMGWVSFNTFLRRIRNLKFFARFFDFLQICYWTLTTILFQFVFEKFVFWGKKDVRLSRLIYINFINKIKMFFGVVIILSCNYFHSNLILHASGAQAFASFGM